MAHEAESPMTHAILMSMLLLQASASAPVAQPSSPPPSDSNAASTLASNAPPEDPVVCRRVAVAGSAFDKKECHTLKTWNRMARDGY